MSNNALMMDGALRRTLKALFAIVKEALRVALRMSVMADLCFVKRKVPLRFWPEDLKSYCQAVILTLGAAFIQRKLPIMRPRILLGLSMKCNVKCVFCLAHSSLIQSMGEKDAGVTWQLGRSATGEDAFLRFDTLKKVIDDLQYLDPQNLSLTGNGEILLYPHVAEAVAYIRSKPKLEKVSIYLSTNGLILNSLLSEKFIRLGINQINFSINASMPETYRDMHAVDGELFHKVVANIKEFMGLKERRSGNSPQVTASFVLCKINYKELIGMLDLCRSLGIKQVGFLTMYFCKGKEGALSDYILSENEKKELVGLIFEAILYAKKINIISNLNGLLNILKKDRNENYIVKIKDGYNCQINANGIVNPYDFPCQMGNVYKDNILGIWYSVNYFKFRNIIKKKALRKERIPTRPFCLRCEQSENEKARCNIVF